MAGIAGIARENASGIVARMLGRIAHRGGGVREIASWPEATLGAARAPSPTAPGLKRSRAAEDGPGFGHAASARFAGRRLVLERDPLGVAPLYFGHARDGALCFASEVKALLEATDDVRAFPPGGRLEGDRLTLRRRRRRRPLGDPPGVIAARLRRHLEAAVRRRIAGETCGAWLSGGLDSSAMAALARPCVRRLHTFAAGFPGAPDLGYARAMAAALGAVHHEIIVGTRDLLRILPETIYHLESFDALLVRSSLTHYLAARAAADHVGDVFSGEGADELFAGYAYLRTLAPAALADELEALVGRLHCTALQRVDRCAAAHGLRAHIAFLDPGVVDYALRIPAALKRRGGVEKWILREALRGLLPEAVRTRTKAKFWQGAGVSTRLADQAERRVSARDFRRERVLPNGWTLGSREELMYYRLFRERFGACRSLDWMGRTPPHAG